MEQHHIRVGYVPKVDTPEKLKQLMNGAFYDDENIYSVKITSGAHPNVLSLAKEFGKYPYHNMKFIDSYGNSISINAEYKSVLANLHTGANLTLGIPANYEEYNINFDWNATITDDDINYMVQWDQATNLKFIDYDDVPARLAQRIEAGARFNRLKTLTLSLHEHTYNTLQIKPFLANLPSLDCIRFDHHFMFDSQHTSRFHENQGQFTDWTFETSECPKFVQYRRNLN